MGGRRGVLALAVACGLVAGGCSSGGESDQPRKESLAPQFLPESAPSDGGSTTTSGATATPSAGGGSTSPGVAGAGPGAPGPPAPGTSAEAPGDGSAATGEASLEASIVDPSGDVTPSPLDRPPAWADLVGGRLIRTAGGFELRVRLHGGSAPTATADDDHTMNIASFYDLDGDGRIDTEIWLNVASTGWGATWFDNVGDGGGFQEGSGVKVAPEGDEVVARFPLSHLGGAERFRWALASEWGRYETIGTVAAARDDLPDNDNIAAFPGE